MRDVTLERITGQVSTQKIKSKQFKLKTEAVAWAKKQKVSMHDPSVKWETNKITGDAPMKWEAVVYKNV